MYGTFSLIINNLPRTRFEYNRACCLLCCIRKARIPSRHLACLGYLRHPTAPFGANGTVPTWRRRLCALVVVAHAHGAFGARVACAPSSRTSDGGVIVVASDDGVCGVESVPTWRRRLCAAMRARVRRRRARARCMTRARRMRNIVASIRRDCSVAVRVVTRRP